jgi:hypothetical protein
VRTGVPVAIKRVSDDGQCAAYILTVKYGFECFSARGRTLIINVLVERFFIIANALVKARFGGRLD